MNEFHFHDGNTCHGCSSIKRATNHHLKYKQDIDIMRVKNTTPPCYVGIVAENKSTITHWHKKGYKTVVRIRWKPEITPVIGKYFASLIRSVEKLNG